MLQTFKFCRYLSLTKKCYSCLSDYTKQSIEMALLSLNPEHYTCAPTVPVGVNDPPASAAKVSEGVTTAFSYLAGAAAAVGVAALLLSALNKNAKPDIKQTGGA